MWIVGESSVSNQGRQSWEGLESKAEEETERIRKQKNQNQKRRSGNWYGELEVSRFLGETYFDVLSPNNFVHNLC